jgi:hypothetical protein
MKAISHLGSLSILALALLAAMWCVAAEPVATGHGLDSASVNSTNGVPGEDLGWIVVDGKTNRVTKIGEVNPVSVQVFYSSGAGHLGATKVLRQDLPAELRSKYPYDAEKAAEYRKQRAELEAQMEDAQKRKQQVEAQMRSARDLLPVASKWKGEMVVKRTDGHHHTYPVELLVLDRNGTTFKARFEVGKDDVREVKGTLVADQVRWSAKDTKVIEGYGGPDYSGTITGSKMVLASRTAVSSAVTTLERSLP